MARGADYPYTQVLGADLFQSVSKDALAAVAVSLLTGGGDRIGSVDVGALLAEELDALHGAGIVPRRLPARFPRPEQDQ